MKRLECPREADVFDAVVSRRWPDRVDAELGAHVSACEVCSDVATVASAIGTDHEAAWSEAVALPRADVVWFRAQARARAEASRAAARPIAIMQGLGFACAAAVISLLIGVVAYWVWTRADWLQTVAVLPALPAFDLVAFDAMSLAIRGTLIAVGLWLVLAPVAVYLVASDD
jgi:hypothetical protein